MNENTNNKKNSTVNQWYKTAISTAAVGAVFSFVVLVFIFGNFVRSSFLEAKQERELINLKAEIVKNPGNEQLLEKIRKRDLRYRQNIFRRMDFNKKGGYLLLGCVIIMLVGFKTAVTLEKKMPLPQHGGDNLKEQIRDAMLSRWSVTSALVVLVFGAILFAGRSNVIFYEEQAGEVIFPTDEEIAQNWPRFRGPGGLGISAYTNIPESWDGKTGENILWKSPVPLSGRNSPVVWQDKVFLAGGDPNAFNVFCYDANSGSLLWKGDVTNIISEMEEPFEVMEDTGYSAPTVTTDGQRVYAIFVTGIVACFDFVGNNVWEKDLGIPESMYGYATSLTMFQNMLLIQFDQGDEEDNKSKIIVMDGATSRVIREIPRAVPNSWTTPIVVKIGDDYQFITAADPWVISYNPENGKELWRVDCLGTDPAPSPIYGAGLIFAVRPYSKLIAIKPDGRGDVTETHIAWSVSGNAPDICSPVCDGKYVYTLTMDGYLSCFRTSDGETMYEQDVGDYFQASPSLVGDKLYLLSDSGVMFIAQAGAEYKELAKCELGEKCSASPAFMDGRIYIRGEQNLYCIEKRIDGND
jgi:outer membrane protein assembly factor BamB